jgi:hypothetical protein
MKLAIYNRGIAFDGSSPFTQPLGGSETSIVHMARELARCGHAVTVYANTRTLPYSKDGVGHSTALSTATTMNSSATMSVVLGMF